MLTRYQLRLEPDRKCCPEPEWGYRLYAALLKRAPETFGDHVHQNSVTPIGQYFTADQDGLWWTVNLLGEESVQALGKALEEENIFFLKKDGILLKTVQWRKEQIDDVDRLLQLATEHSGVHRLTFCTPTAFKSRGQYISLPTSRLIVQSLIKKWNGCFLDCPIEDVDGEGMEVLASGLRCTAFQIRDRKFRLKGNAIPGFVGSMTLCNEMSGFHRQLGNALLLFADYAGIGIKTTLGMGGVKR